MPIVGQQIAHDGGEGVRGVAHDAQLHLDHIPETTPYSLYYAQTIIGN